MRRSFLFALPFIILAGIPFGWRTFQERRTVGDVIVPSTDYQKTQTETVKRLAVLVHDFPNAKTFQVSWSSEPRNCLTYFAREQKLVQSPIRTGFSAASGWEQTNVSVEDLNLAVSRGWNSAELGAHCASHHAKTSPNR